MAKKLSIQLHLERLSIDVRNIKKEICDIKTEQKKLTAYANMGRGGLRVIIAIGFILVSLFSIGFFLGKS